MSDYKSRIKQALIDKLKNEHFLWSYDTSSITDIPRDMLIELVMLHLDLDDINLLFQIYSRNQIKQAWLHNLVVQGERYETLNRFFAWYYFDIKQPKRYVKIMATRQFNKRLGLK